jgi:hypothetical protein
MHKQSRTATCMESSWKHKRLSDQHGKKAVTEHRRRDAGICINRDKLDDASCKDTCRKEVNMAGVIARVIEVS